MNSLFRSLFKPTAGPASIVLIRLAVGLIFVTQEILKYTDPNMGAVRFNRIGFPHPGLNRFLLGSVSEAVARHAPCSVEIVRAQA